jgi:hypothetical protein
MYDTQETVPNVEQARPGHTPNFDSLPVTAFARGVEVLHPGASGSVIAELLEHRAKRTTVLQWKAGRRQAPQWAMDMLTDKIQARADALHAEAARIRKVPERIGLKAGARNLAAYLAKRDR